MSDSPPDLPTGPSLTERLVNNQLIAAVEHHKAGRLDQAEAGYRKVLEFHAENGMALAFLGAVLAARGMLEAAAGYLERAVARLPADAGLLADLGDVYRRLKREAEAEAAFRRALDADPGSVAALNGLGILYQAALRLDEAVAYLERARALAPDAPEVHNNLCFALLGQGRYDEAAAAGRRAVALRPGFAEALNNLGNALQAKGQRPDALACYREAVRHDGENAAAWNNFATALQFDGRIEDAIVAYRRALEFEPDRVVAAAALLHQYRRVCAWDQARALEPRVAALVEAALARGEVSGEAPHHTLGRTDDPAINRAVAKAFSDELERRMASLGVSFAAPTPPAGDRLVIGYLSSDFGDHPVAHQVAGLFERHDRHRVAVRAYSAGPDDASPVRRRIEAGVDAFVDVHGLDAAAAARRIRADGVHVLVELGGHTHGNRLDVCALRPAPVQATYLGFAGTTGAGFLDYVLCDAVVVPAGDEPFYTERPVRLPVCYMATDPDQPIDPGATRAAAGLPDDGVVLCSFNHTFKISIETFQAWMAALKAVPEAMLWLAAPHRLAAENLRRAAIAFGVDPARLVFAERTPTRAAHLGRLRLADLALDTWPYTGHSTTVDALWAGVPVLTRRGRHYASRASASIVAAAGLGELVAPDPDGYQGRLIELARDRDRLRDLGRTLTDRRAHLALFDADRFVRDLERAFGHMWARHAAGLEPAAFDVAALPPLDETRAP